MEILFFPDILKNRSRDRITVSVRIADRAAAGPNSFRVTSV